jgi:hypothetical protein
MEHKSYKSNDKIYILKRSKLEERWNNSWDDKYNLFLQFIKEFGSQRVPFSEKSPNYKPEYKSLYTWTLHQRELYNSGELLDWRYQALKKINFDFCPLETQWLDKYNKVLQFKEIYEHCNASIFDEEYKVTAKWLQEQRVRKHYIDPFRVEKLNEIDFDWGVKFKNWDYMYDMLRDYYLKHGTSTLSTTIHYSYPAVRLDKLHKWTIKQILLYHNGELPKDRVKLLEKLEFDFHKKNFDKEKFLKSKRKSTKRKHYGVYIIKLAKFRKKYGTFNVPPQWQEDPELADWLIKVRAQKIILSQKELEKLEKMNFTWSVSQENWERNVRALIKYKEENGHTHVYFSEDGKLARWASSIKQTRKGTIKWELSPERIQELDDIGFEW